MPSAPIEMAARAATFASFLNCGQLCTSAEKILVHDAVYDEFLPALQEHVAALRIGNGPDKVDIAPMIRSRRSVRSARPSFPRTASSSG
jgi:betaine-aldehyde dehydrogenase